ncbi:uncharacterized protein LOC127284556 [Leptopilina boulardi]|uniref:uncharacterized protein LOC127284556 n=1 Tax=Leptopilina boulardi TaxID=63433 RepID=UPI0021F53352|nr:uncharacterized protein LOC127284556 [Leptopilina boulardi]
MKMLKKAKKLKSEPVELDDVKIELDSIIKVDPDSSPSYESHYIKEDPFIDLSSDLENNEINLNFKKFNEEIDLNDNDDSLNQLEENANREEPSTASESSSPKKRKKMSRAEESALRQQKLITNHPVRKGCDTCRLKCNIRITPEMRDKTNKEFWSLIGLVRRRSFILNLVKRCEIKRRTVDVKHKKRNNVFMYYVKDNNGKEQQVCKTFFLTTLGFKPSNDSIILNTMHNFNKETLEPKMDMRGKIKNPDKMESRRKAIQEHILSLYPCVPHFQRDDDLPIKRYLSNDLTVKDMHGDFLRKYSEEGGVCSYDLYRNLLIEMNILFAKVGIDECDLCDIFNKHHSDHNKNHLSPDCDICEKWSIHMKRYSEAKDKYQNLLLEIAYNQNSAYFTTDMQKPLVLPKLESSLIFTRRLVTFNKSFIPLGNIENNVRPIVFLWHEAIAGRQEEDIISVFHQFFIECRDKKRIVLWLDDSYHQNKNWKFLTFLLYIVNSNDVEIECVEIYYFEAGHNPSTESFFHHIEASLKRKGKIYDFKDFENAVRQACSRNPLLKSLTPWDFREFKDLSSPQKLKTLISKPLMNDIRYLTAVRGSYILKFRMNYDDNIELADLDFLQMKIAKFGFSRPEIVGAYRGIPNDKKKEIIENLVKDMPMSRRQFWYDLPEGDFLDLIDNYS